MLFCGTCSQAQRWLKDCNSVYVQPAANQKRYGYASVTVIQSAAGPAGAGIVGFMASGHGGNACPAMPCDCQCWNHVAPALQNRLVEMSQLVRLCVLANCTLSSVQALL